MITVEEADKIIQSQIKNLGTETVSFEASLGRILAEDIKADRDLPPFNRSTMDGIAINYKAFEKGIRSYKILSTQAAGDSPVEISKDDECIEIMTGAALPHAADTVIRYEDVNIKDGIASIISDNIYCGQSIHFKGKDKKKHDVVVKADRVITPAIIGISASVGKYELQVKKLPRIIIISTGNELVEVNKTPGLYQIRSSNSFTIQALLQKKNITPDLLHIPDNAEITKTHLQNCLQQYDVILLTGGVSMGKFDYVPEALESLGINKLFHKVRQRPGKPFWFGAHLNGTLVFAFPGNPVSTFMCMHRFFLPWLEASMGLETDTPSYAILNKDVTFMPPLQYFLQVKLSMDKMGQLLARPVEGNGSGDFANLADADAFLELPAEQEKFKSGEIFRFWKFE